jgi:RNA polymerase sigma-70 factor (ECF subfamily)
MADTATDLLRAHYLASKDKLRAFLINMMGSAHDGEDVLQDLFIRINTAQLPSAVHNPTSFLFSMAANLAKDQLRRNSLSKRIIDGDYSYLKQVSGDGLPSGEAAVWSRQWIAKFKSAIAEMPVRQRQVFVLHKIENLTQRATAERLGISVKMVEKHMARALTHCRQSLGQFLPGEP